MHSGTDVARAWFDHSPFLAHLSLELVSLDPDRAKVRLPYAPELATAGEVVHGGAISSLMDTAAALAAWSAHDPGDGATWGTVAMAITFQAAAKGQDLVADAQVTRRGRTLTFIEVTVEDPEERTVAQALVTYRLG